MTLRDISLLMPLVSVLLTAWPGWAQSVNYEMVTVGDLGNAADTMGYGAVPYAYQIGKYEVTIGQYAAFLNAVAKSDPYSLYNTSMASNLNIAGISRSGTSGNYSYSVISPSGTSPAGASSPGNRPITYVSWFDAARFANWMQNGQGAGSTETGSYTLNGVAPNSDTPAPARNPGATFYIPTENEWYKAAFYSPVLNSGFGGYYTYATQSDVTPGNNIGSGSNQANYQAAMPYPFYTYSVTQSSVYSSGQNYLTDVGAFTNSASHYGTFDQSGNVQEWNDLAGAASVSRGVHAGAWIDGWNGISSSGMVRGTPSGKHAVTGFRLAGLVPGPTINVASGTFTQAQAGYATLAGALPVSKIGDGTLLLTAANALTGAFFVRGGHARIDNSAALSASPVTVEPRGVLTLSPGLHANIGGLSPKAGGLIDVGTGKITVRSGLSASNLTSAILSGLATGTSGIMSSDAARLPDLRTVGWVSNGDGSVTFGYAAPGDGTLDGIVDIMDIAFLLASGKYGTRLPATWRDGDFNHDGMLDDLDIAGFLSTGLFNNGYYNTPAGTIAAVPEPNGGALVGTGLGLASVLAARRKRVA